MHPFPFRSQLIDHVCTTNTLCRELGGQCSRCSSLTDTSFVSVLVSRVGWVSSVGIATRYRLDSSGIKSRWGLDFPHPSRPTLGPTQPPIQLVPGLSRG